jgi:hypothetical protein
MRVGPKTRVAGDVVVESMLISFEIYVAAMQGHPLNTYFQHRIEDIVRTELDTLYIQSWICPNKLYVLIHQV